MIEQVCDQIAKQLSERLHMPAYGYVPLNLPIKPAAVVFADNLTYNRTSRNAQSDLELTAAILIGRADEEQSQRAAHRYMDPSGSLSVKGAVESDRTLDGIAKDCVVQSVDGITYSDIANDSILVVQFKVLVIL